MTPSEVKQMLPIITAFAEGKAIQVSRYGEKWTDATCLDFSWDPSCYRIKPRDPMALWVVRYADGSLSYHPNEQAARIFAQGSVMRDEVEVIQLKETPV